MVHNIMLDIRRIVVLLARVRMRLWCRIFYGLACFDALVSIGCRVLKSRHTLMKLSTNDSV